jgi:uncharacterized membrane protein YphA (DoxX/SURF4 family)
MRVLDYDRATPIQKTNADVGLLAARVPLGVYFALAGFAKIRMGVGSFVSGSLGSVPSFMPEVLGKAFLYTLPFAELIVGACLVIGLVGRIAALLATLMLISFTIAVTGLKDEPKPFHANLVFLGIALALALIGPGRLSVDALFPRRAPKP